MTLNSTCRLSVMTLWQLYQNLTAVFRISECGRSKKKINDSQTEFIVFRSKQDVSSLSISVGDSIISQSSNVEDLGVIFD